MPRKQQGWITFQSSTTEKEFLEQYCQQVQRTKTEVLRDFLRSLGQMLTFYDKEDAALSLDVRELVRQKLESHVMKVSARNALKGTVKKVVKGAVNAEVVIEIAPGVEVTSIITMDSVENLGLAEGQEAYAVIKSSDVMVAVA